MKVVVQIPCLNEEATLASVLETIPKSIPGIDNIEILIIDDGSTDQTVAVAKSHGVKEFVYHTSNQGLGRSFHDGVLRALELGADIVVNTDGDNQYPQARIPDLVKPILERQADIVIADRQTHTIEHFSLLKKLLQRLGSSVVNRAAGTKLPDAASGFRAYSHESLIRLNTVTSYSYTMETIIQAGNKHLAITSVPINTNPQTRSSRLFKSNTEHVLKSAAAIIRAYIMYAPLAVFISLGSILLIAGLIPFVRFLYFFMVNIRGGTGVHHLQSLIAGSVLLIVSVIIFVLGLLADLTRINRVLVEHELELVKKSYLRKFK